MSSINELRDLILNQSKTSVQGVVTGLEGDQVLVRTHTGLVRCIPIVDKHYVAGTSVTIQGNVLLNQISSAPTIKVYRV